MTRSTALTSYRAWADGTVQDYADEPYAWMSDDFMVIEAEDEDAAHDEAERRDAAAWSKHIQQT